jgi:hypothetical protein
MFAPVEAVGKQASEVSKEPTANIIVQQTAVFLFRAVGDK